MKAISKFFGLFIALQVISWTVPAKASAQVSVSFQVFYDNLSPYGNWVDNSDYGYVWVPRVAHGFSPYGTNGYWVFTDDGWTWVSNYSWGWAPFHYGRWFNDSYYGWIWVPDNEWGPGWVSWRRSDDYYGWAPMGPGISIDIAYSNAYNLPYNQWTFVRHRDFGRTNINNYYIGSSNNTTIINNSTAINNVQADRTSKIRFNAGPDRAEVERHVGKTFSPVVLRERVKPGQTLAKGELQIYRPQVQKSNSGDHKPTPTKVDGWRNAKTEEPKNTPTQTARANQPNKQPAVGNGNNQRNNLPASQRPRTDQRPKQEPAMQQHRDQPVKQQPSQPKRNELPARQKSATPKRNDQPVRQQPTTQRHNDQPVRQMPDHTQQPARQQPSTQKHNDVPKQKPSPAQRKHDN